MSDANWPEVNLWWPPDKVREFCETTDEWVLHLGPSWTSGEIEALYRHHTTVAEPYLLVISEIVDDARTPAWILDEAWIRFRDDPSTMSSLACNPNARTEVLKQLCEYPNEEVHEHAHLNLRWRAMHDFFGGYFHEDFRLEFASAAAAVDEYLLTAVPDDARRVAEGVSDLVQRPMSDEELGEHLFKELGCVYLPSADGLTHRAWLEAVAAQLLRAVDGRSPDNGQNE